MAAVPVSFDGVSPVFSLIALEPFHFMFHVSHNACLHV